MKVFKLIFKNALRHKLRSFLTMFGIAIAVLAFGLIRTAIDAWYAGVEASAQNRLVTRSAVSLAFQLPLAYRDQIAKVPGVESVGLGNWFGAYYKDPSNWFANFAVDQAYLDMYPEFVVPPEQKAQYLKERNACIVGRKLAQRFGWKLDDVVQLTGTFIPGNWDFVIRGIYDGQFPNTDETAFFFHWEYVNERMKQEMPSSADQIGWFMVKIANSANSAQISEAIDAYFKNSYAETKTETERAFQQSFVSMSGTILTALQMVSIVVVFIILLVLANTMAMTARERFAEYAVMKTLGFRPFHIIGLIGGESLFIAIGGFIIGYLLLAGIVTGLEPILSEYVSGFFPVFELKDKTVLFAFIAALLTGLASAAFPILRAVKMRIADGLQRAMFSSLPSSSGSLLKRISSGLVKFVAVTLAVIVVAGIYFALHYAWANFLWKNLFGPSYQQLGPLVLDLILFLGLVALAWSFARGPRQTVLANLWTQRLTTALTLSGVALVVFVFVAALMLANGLKETLVATGVDENAIIIRRSSQSEINSGIEREQASIIKTQPEVAALGDGSPFATSDVVVVISLPKKESDDLANVMVRGVSPQAVALREKQVTLTQGRMFVPGLQEVIIGKALQERFKGCEVGGSLRMASTQWKIAGVFDGHGTGFDSEVWGDVEVMAPAFRRSNFSSVTVRLKDAGQFEALKTRLENDRRMVVEVKREKEYYEEQSRMMANFIGILGRAVTIIFSFGAMIGAMITMFAAVANRTQEIGTLRAIGFRRRSVLAAFLVEAVFLALLGGAAGIIASSALNLITVSTTNWTTFSELAFGFDLSTEITGRALVFAIVMGLFGGFLPAVRASRLKIIEALRTG
jgi:putative ABC transport system permease protein